MEQGTLGRVLALGNTRATHTNLIVQTFAGGFAGRRADAETAEHAGRTLFFGGTQLQLGTPLGGVTGKASLTETSRNMVSRLTFRILAADIWEAADIHALVVDTGTAERTVRVGYTFQLQAADIWVALGSCRTSTGGLMVDRAT